MKPFRAIAAMSLNRVIGNKNEIPWHIPEDFRWFKECTVNQVVVFGRKTYESLKKSPLPGRQNWVLTHRSFNLIHHHELVHPLHSLEDLERTAEVQKNKKIWICGGEQIYKQLLPRCEELFLTVVKKKIEGDRFFPEFESYFIEKDTIKETAEYKIVRYENSHPTWIILGFPFIERKSAHKQEENKENNDTQLPLSI